MKLKIIANKIDLYYNINICDNRLIDKKIKHKVRDGIGVFNIIESLSDLIYKNESE